MTVPLKPVLPTSDRLLLKGVARIVPSRDRSDWLRSWEAELWWRRHPRTREVHFELFTDLSVGLCRDALWLRVDSCRRVLQGTAVLCLSVLALACLFSSLAAVCLYGGWHDFQFYCLPRLSYFLVASPLILGVTSATADRRPDLSRSRQALGTRCWRFAFLAAKVSSLLMLMYLLSLDLCSFAVVAFPQACEYMQLLLFVISSICGLRWAFQDQERRCKACLRLLNEPRPVGRPSHNLIEQSANESACRKGHGFLSVPELETSWRQSSEWIGSLRS